jgi:hypothetical protein
LKWGVRSNRACSVILSAIRAGVRAQAAVPTDAERVVPVIFTVEHDRVGAPRNSPVAGGREEQQDLVALGHADLVDLAVLG